MDTDNDQSAEKIPEYQAYLFDADGTLLDTVELIYRSFLFTIDRYKTEFCYRNEFSREDIISRIGIPLRTQIEHYFGTLSDEKYHEVSSEYRDHQMSIYRKYLRLFPGIKKVLKSIHKRGKKLGIVTSRKIDSAGLYLQATGIDRYFSVVMTPEQTEKHKPDPEPVLEAMKRLDTSPKSTVFVGDALYDIKAGKAAGIDTIFVGWSHNKVDELEVRPDYIIKSAAELLSF